MKIYQILMPTSAGLGICISMVFMKGATDAIKNYGFFSITNILSIIFIIFGTLSQIKFNNEA